MQLVLDLLVPGIIAGVSCYGMAKKVDVYEALLQGAAKGLEILLRILPALVTLLTVVAMLRPAARPAEQARVVVASPPPRLFFG